MLFGTISVLPISILVTFLYLLALPVYGGRSCVPRTCKAIAGDADWPSHETWDAFNESLGGRLLQPAPPGAVCHPGQLTYDPDQCLAVIDGWSTFDFHAFHPTSLNWNQFSHDSCLPDPSYSCDSSGYPTFVVNATKPTHVQLSIDFAREHNVRLIIKSTGHDFLGRSIAPNSLSIWTRHLNGIEYHPDSFSPRGCRRPIEGNAVTAQGGTQMIDLYEFLDTYNETILGGGGKTVGIGGFVTGGGHSHLSPWYGLAADQVLEMEIATPNGELVTANECQNEDLFWAMRGGGGSTFGVLTSVTMKTYPSPKILHATIAAFTTPGSPQVIDYQAFVLSRAQDIADTGGPRLGYIYAEQAMPNVYIPDGPEFLAGVLGILLMKDTHDEADMMDVIDPIMEEAQQRFPDANMTYVPVIEKYDSFLQWYQLYHDQGEGGINAYMSSGLLDAESLEDVDALKSALENIAERSNMVIAHLVGGKGVREAKPRGGGNSVNPAWRQTYIHAVSTIPFMSHNETAEAEAIENIGLISEVFHKLAPGNGAYINEASPFEPDYQHTFWGNNYERLLEIKREIDPHDVFWCHPCIGNERWTEFDGKLCRV